ncbi:MAG TPA: hypothetical protein VKB67_07070 [Rhizomicrobium sp.]|nr:hypothetical protein [Rhizomicrobium sp.]
MATKILLASFAFLAAALPAKAQTAPPVPGSILNNPDAPRLPPPANPNGMPPLPTIIPSTILIPGSGH